MVTRLNSKKTLFPAERVSQKCFHEGGRKFFFFGNFFMAIFRENNVKINCGN